MQYDITFAQLSNAEFENLINPVTFRLQSNNTTTEGTGEKVFSGTASTGETCTLFEYFNSTDNASFLISEDGKSVQYTFTEAASPETVKSLIRGSITKFCLQQQGYFCLHAAGIRIDDRVILFIGQKGAGKSTLSAYFNLQGWPVWCDDYSVLLQQPDGFKVEQGEQSLKVTAATVAALQIPITQLESVFTYTNQYAPNQADRHIEGKYYFGSGDSTPHPEPLPLAAVYLLQPREQAPLKIIRHPEPGSAFAMLMQEIMLPGLNSKRYLQLYFNSVKALLDKVPVYAVHAPDDVARIDEVYKAVLAAATRHDEPIG